MFHFVPLLQQNPPKRKFVVLNFPAAEMRVAFDLDNNDDEQKYECLMHGHMLAVSLRTVSNLMQHYWMLKTCSTQTDKKWKLVNVILQHLCS